MLCSLPFARLLLVGPRGTPLPRPKKPPACAQAR